jgi:predicted AAA+ superfamily ATPase
VRHLGASFPYYLEINLDEDKAVRPFFDEPLSEEELCARLSLYYNKPVIPGKTLLFFDEIQSFPAALSRLRYFYEKMPDLHVIAAGSLLEFALKEIPSFGVGRIRSLYIYPFCFTEFLGARGETALAQALAEAGPGNPLPEPIHQKLLKLYKVFLVIGGMPEAVARYVETRNFLEPAEAQNDLLVSFRDDFAKYKARLSTLIISEVFEAVVRMSEGKFVYEKAAEGRNNWQVKEALELLSMAGLVYSVYHTDANGLPLGAEINPRFRRVFLCDTGLFLNILSRNAGGGRAAAQILEASDFAAVNRGALAEIATGLEFIKSSSCYDTVQLYCWQRSVTGKNPRQSSAQVDFIIQRGDSIVPVEVKSGERGTMQSLRLFLAEKDIPRGIRISMEITICSSSGCSAPSIHIIVCTFGACS